MFKLVYNILIFFVIFFLEYIILLFIICFVCLQYSKKMGKILYDLERVQHLLQ
jgi:hypothetical protein